jgi:hypothetical protein
MARSASLPSLTAAQALYILEKLIDERKVNAGDVRRHLGTLWQEMNFLEKRIAELKGIAAVAKHPVHEAKVAVKKIQRRRRRRTVTAERAASQKVQGQYLGFLRQIPKTARKKFQDLAKTKGREAAIEEMKKKLGK